MTYPTLLFVAFVIASCTLFGCALGAQDLPTGYTDTPLVPGSAWRVHDPDRPMPEVVTSGERFSESASPPAGAVVLFDGADLSAFERAAGGTATWKVENGYFEVVAGEGSIRTRDSFRDFQLHIEWASPAEVESNSQGRGNSGLFLHGVFEIQVLDSWENPTYADGQAAAMYGQYPPRVNASRPPGVWQSYDIVFEAPRFDGDSLREPARVTVLHNGVVVHHRREFLGPTLHRAAAEYGEALPERAPIGLQDHGNPVRFRNVWLLPLGEEDQ